VDRSWSACAGAGGEYVNFASGDDTAAAAAYGGQLTRLRAAKRRYDPNNLFCLNANIDPEDVAG
jgi:FAD/FMN-containing dehydrogenase